MPNYDYECETCGKRFELFQSMKDDKLVTCPTSICDQGGKVKRLLGTGGGIIDVRFNGEASAAPDAEAALSNLLSILGQRQGAKSILKMG